MAAAGIGDFWRRRRIMIVLGLIFLCIVAAFIHVRSSKRPKSTNTAHEEVEKSHVNTNNNKNKAVKWSKNKNKKIKDLPPMFNPRYFKGKKPIKKPPDVPAAQNDLAKELNKWRDRLSPQSFDKPADKDKNPFDHPLRVDDGDDDDFMKPGRPGGKVDKKKGGDLDHLDSDVNGDKDNAKEPEDRGDVEGEAPQEPKKVDNDAGKKHLKDTDEKHHKDADEKDPDKHSLHPDTDSRLNSSDRNEGRRRLPNLPNRQMIPPQQLDNQNQFPQRGNENRFRQPVNQNQLPQRGNENRFRQPVNQNQLPQAGNQNQLPQAGNQNQYPQAGNRNQYPQAQYPQAGNQNQYPQGGNQNRYPQAGNQRGGNQNNQYPPQAGKLNQSSRAGNPNQYPKAGNPNQYPRAGNQRGGNQNNQYPPQAGNLNQSPQAGNPNQYPQAGNRNRYSQQDSQNRNLNPNDNQPAEPAKWSNQPGDRGRGRNLFESSPDNPNELREPNQASTSSPDPDTLYIHSSMPLGPPLTSKKTKRQEAVVKAFKHAWKAYKDYAWGEDEVNPVSHTSSSSFFNMGLTLVDSLDTLWLMGLEEDFAKARDWVAKSLDIEHSVKTVSLFEANIRVLGGLLSAYHLSGDGVFLDKAIKLGTRLLPAFDTPSGIPSNTVSLSSGSHSGRTISTAEAGSLQLEFRDLSRASGNPAYQKACDRTSDKILSQSHGVVRQILNCNSGQFSGSVYSVGAGIDSYYEYLIKIWIQSGMTEDKFRTAYEDAVKGIETYLVGYSQPSHMAYLGKRFSLGTGQRPSPIMDHLSCFYPGTLALGVLYEVLPGSRPLAENLTHTCYYMYNSTSPTKLAPEIFQFNTDAKSKEDIRRSSDSQNIQRPETVESLFNLYRLTKNEQYREWGWEIFQAFEKYTRIESGGYACLKSVYTPGQFRDRTESFFLAETLKYLYLLFGDDDSVLSLKEWVFNTEAHPLPIWKMS